MFLNMRFDYVNDWSQPENHDIIVKHVQSMLSIQMPLIGQFSARSQCKITWKYFKWSYYINKIACRKCMSGIIAVKVSFK